MFRFPIHATWRFMLPVLKWFIRAVWQRFSMNFSMSLNKHECFRVTVHRYIYFIMPSMSFWYSRPGHYCLHVSLNYMSHLTFLLNNRIPTRRTKPDNYHPDVSPFNIIINSPPFGGNLRRRNTSCGQTLHNYRYITRLMII